MNLPPAPHDPAAIIQQHPDLLSGLPRWQRVYLSSRAAGNDHATAAKAAHNTSAFSVSEWLAKSNAGLDGGKFARAHASIVEGVYVAGGPAAVRARHLESADAILDRVEKMALAQLTDASGAPELVRHRDQLGAVGHYLAAVQLTGAPSSPAPGAAVTIVIVTRPQGDLLPRRIITARALGEPGPGDPGSPSPPPELEPDRG